MIVNYNEKYADALCELGKVVNPNFKKLFIDNKSPLSKFYLYLKDNKVVGFLNIEIIDNNCEILNIVVKELYQHQHIATQLLEYVFEYKYNKYYLEVADNNIPAINLYKKSGFKEVNVRKKYYSNADAIIMIKE